MHNLYMEIEDAYLYSLCCFTITVNGHEDINRFSGKLETEHFLNVQYVTQRAVVNDC